MIVFVEVQDINLRDNLQGSKCDGDCIFLWELFLFYEEVPSTFDPAGFFQLIVSSQ